jgi:hypothetical protein
MLGASLSARPRAACHCSGLIRAGSASARNWANRGSPKTLPTQELRQRLRGAVELDFYGEHRTLTEHFEIPEPGVRIEREHIENALDKRRRGEITGKELADWAAILVMIHAYDWQGSEEGEIADWLHDLSYLPSEIE